MTRYYQFDKMYVAKRKSYPDGRCFANSPNCYLYREPMNTILVSYDLRAPGKNYTQLLSHLRSYPNYINPLESFWILRTTLSPEQVRDNVMLYTDANDRVMAINITGDAAAWINLGAANTQWIKANL